MHKLSSSASREMLTLLRFIAVGTVATLIHLLVAYRLLAIGMHPQCANVAAFLIAFVFSFLGHYLVTFRSASEPRRAIMRFLLISVIAFALNNGLLAILLSALKWPPMLLVLLSLAAVPLFTFLSARLWAFKP